MNDIRESTVRPAASHTFSTFSGSLLARLGLAKISPDTFGLKSSAEARTFRSPGPLARRSFLAIALGIVAWLLVFQFAQSATLPWPFVLLAILVAYGLSLFMMPVRNFYRSGASYVSHLGWSSSAFLWLALALTLPPFRDATQVEADPWAQAVCASLLLLAVVCFLRGTRLTGSWNNSKREKVYGAAFSACFLFTWFFMLMATLPGNGFVYDVLEPHLSRSVLLLVGCAYVLATFQPGAVASLIGHIELPSPTLRDLAQDLLSRIEVVQGWLIVGIILWVDLARWVASDVMGPRTSLNWVPLGTALTILPVYVLLFVPGIRFAMFLAGSRYQDRALDTRTRVALLTQVRLPLWGLFLAAALFWANGFVAAVNRGLSFATNISNLVGDSADHAQSFALIVFVAILLHYILQVELPFWWGQRKWKGEEIARTRQQHDLAASVLAQHAGRLVGESQAVQADGTLLLAAWATYTLAVDQQDVAGHITVHTFSSGLDLVRKVAYAAATSVATSTLAGHAPSILSSLHV